MKAHEGEEIVCGCARPAGIFLHNVDDVARISGKDFAISLDGVPDDRGSWLCPICKVRVAQHFDNHWQVMTKKGWAE